MGKKLNLQRPLKVVWSYFKIGCDSTGLRPTPWENNQREIIRKKCKRLELRDISIISKLGDVVQVDLHMFQEPTKNNPWTWLFRLVPFDGCVSLFCVFIHRPVRIQLTSKWEGKKWANYHVRSYDCYTQIFIPVVYDSDEKVGSEC